MPWNQYLEYDVCGQGDVFHFFLEGPDAADVFIEDAFIDGLKIIAESNRCNAFCLCMRENDEKIAVWFKRLQGTAIVLGGPHWSIRWSRFFLWEQEGASAEQPSGGVYGTPAVVLPLPMQIEVAGEL